MPFMSGTIPTPGVPSGGAPVGGTTNFTDLASMYGGGVPSAGSGVPTAPLEPQLYLGSFYPKAPATGYGDDVTEWALKGATPEKVARIAGISEAIQKFDKMSFKEQRDMLRLLAIGGFAGSISLEDIDEAVNEATQPDARAAYMTLLGDRLRLLHEHRRRGHSRRRAPLCHRVPPRRHGCGVGRQVQLVR